MKKVKLILGGRGAECYVHDINEEQKERLINGGINEDKMTIDLVNEILGIDWIEENARVYVGAYTEPDNFYIAAYDEQNNLIWESNEDFEFNPEFEYNEDFELKDFDNVEEDGLKLVIEDYIKGTYFEYQLELEEEFDPQKLSTIQLDISETVQIIKGLKYNGNKLEISEWGDYWSKGLYFHLYPFFP